MKLQEALDIMRFWSGTLSDITGKSVNNLFSNKQLVQQLNFALLQYAKKTHAIEDIYSFSLNQNEAFVSFPPLALRSEAFRFILVIIQGRYWCADMQEFANVYQNFPYAPIVGITNWFLAWGTEGNSRMYPFPLKNIDSNTAVLTSDITSTDTTIPVGDTSGFMQSNGKITIGSEKIHYQYKDTTNFYGCERGMEQTTASAHSTSDTVNENSCWIFYYRKHIDFQFVGENILETELEKDLEIPEEHIETVLKYAVYNLLIKLDANRAIPYKVDWEQFLEDATYEIKKGRSNIKKGRNIRNPYMFENSIPYAPNLY